MSDRWPLVGRQRELDSIAAVLGDPGARAVVLAGTAGVGKTRLGAEVLALADGRGYATARVLATRTTSGLPLGALAPLLPPLVAPPDQPVDVLPWARAAVVAAGGGARLALFVDDAHLLDDTSAALVLQLAQAGEAFVVATVRSDEPAPDAIVALWKEDVGDRVEVTALDFDAVGDLLAAVLDGPVDARAQYVLFAHSGGNPLYLRELVTAALDRDILRRDIDAWRLAEGLVLSDRLVELVDARIGALEADEHHALELVSFGEPLPVLALTPELTSALAALERRGLVTIAEDERRLLARLAHPLYGDLVRSRTPNLRARAVNSELAELLERSGGRRREDPLRFARWRIDGGGAVSPELMLRAAQAARTHGDLALARRLAQAAIRAGAGFDGDLLVAQLSMLEGRAEEAESGFAVLAARAGTDEQRVGLAVSRITNLLAGLVRPEDALRVAEEASAGIDDGACHDRLVAVHAQVLYHVGRSGAALAVAAPVLDRAEGRVLVDLAPTAALALTDSGRLTRAVDLARRAHAAHLGLDGPPPAFGPHAHLVSAGVALASAGHLAEAETEARRAYAEAVAAGSLEAQAAFAQLLGWVLVVRGSATEGAQYLTQSLALYRDRGWKAFVMFALANLAHAEALRGDVDAGRQALSELDALAIPDAHGVGDPLVLQGRAWVHAAEGSVAEARRCLVAGAASARRAESLVLEAALLHDHARLGGPGEVAERLAELAAIVEGDLVAARADYAGALVASDPVRLEAVSEAFEAMGAWLYAAEAAAAAAVDLRRAGDRRRATVLERSTAALVRRCDGVVTPALRGIETQAILSARELEVASLAAAGLSNRAIAERLYVSVRTIETQLQHVYEKLGVSRRGDLARALDPS